MNQNPPIVRRRRRRLDLLSIAVAPLGIAVVLIAQWIDGSAFGALLHGSSALVVFGGTLGAVLISYTPTEIARAGKAAFQAFFTQGDDMDALAGTIVSLSIRGHRRGLPALEQELDAEAVSDPLLSEGLSLIVDGASLESLDEVLALDKSSREAEEDLPVRVFEAAAGYAPTMGILGAVLGLMRVMEHLSAPNMLGSGIALAFVATVYGVGLANLVLLPIAGRLRERSAVDARRREMIVHGLHALRERTHPRLVAQRLRVFSVKVPRIDELNTVVRPSSIRTPSRVPRIPA